MLNLSVQQTYTILMNCFINKLASLGGGYLLSYENRLKQLYMIQ